MIYCPSVFVLSFPLQNKTISLKSLLKRKLFCLFLFVCLFFTFVLVLFFLYFGACFVLFFLFCSYLFFVLFVFCFFVFVCFVFVFQFCLFLVVFLICRKGKQMESGNTIKRQPTWERS